MQSSIYSKPRHHADQGEGANLFASLQRHNMALIVVQVNNFKKDKS